MFIKKLSRFVCLTLLITFSGNQASAITMTSEQARTIIGVISLATGAAAGAIASWLTFRKFCPTPEINPTKNNTSKKDISRTRDKRNDAIFLAFNVAILAGAIVAFVTHGLLSFELAPRLVDKGIIKIVKTTFGVMHSNIGIDQNCNNRFTWHAPSKKILELVKNNKGYLNTEAVKNQLAKEYPNACCYFGDSATRKLDLNGGHDSSTGGPFYGRLPNAHCYK